MLDEMLDAFAPASKHYIAFNTNLNLMILFKLDIMYEIHND